MNERCAGSSEGFRDVTTIRSEGYIRRNLTTLRRPTVGPITVVKSDCSRWSWPTIPVKLPSFSSPKERSGSPYMSKLVVGLVNNNN
ncbi:hypothetical protein Hamer_G007865 [Homarus americanus]|uniref:Uncharacterized protein n=1 Tax=Homarus americanus TaxID=6706 RepID=A0A8J5MT13_HOMAM|nr:hypothetical protein Hamer_G007865 [Homarus americanus]